MTGTSADGLDWCQVRFSGKGPYPRFEVLDSNTIPYPSNLHARFLRTLDLTSTELAAAHFALGRWLGRACRDLATGCDAIANHGQTLVHAPPEYTLQIGLADAIRRHTGLPVIHDLRSADVLAGGQGAPLIPVVDDLLFQPRTDWVVALNIGGIANFTLLPPQSTNDPIRAWDTGPGNMLLDAVIQEYSKGKLQYDKDGELALRGKLNPGMLDFLQTHPYLSLTPPKSAGREQFGAAYLSSVIEQFNPRKDQDWYDLLHTLACFTADCVADEWSRDHAGEIPAAIWVSGGGAHHPLIMDRLRMHFRPAPVQALSLNGVDTDNKEAFGFAYLGYLNLRRLPANLPSVTGAAEKVILGQIAW